MLRNFKIKTNAPLIIPTVLIVFVMVLFLRCSYSEEQTVTKFTTLTLQDEFSVDGAPDSTLWTYDTGTGTNGWGNNELQYYTDRTENITVQNGVLIITANKENLNGSAYTSARIKTQGLFEQQYGRFEACMRLPYGQGMWPAFWLLGNNINSVGWPQCGEIDIMEYRGQKPTLIQGAVHGPGYSAGNAISKSYDLVNSRFDTKFHVFGIEWGPEYINYYVDDVLYHQITSKDVTGEWVLNRPFFIIINLAVGGDFVGAPNVSGPNETVFPQYLLVDYVRAYSYN